MGLLLFRCSEERFCLDYDNVLEVVEEVKFLKNTKSVEYKNEIFELIDFPQKIKKNYNFNFFVLMKNKKCLPVEEIEGILEEGKYEFLNIHSFFIRAFPIKDVLKYKGKYYLRVDIDRLK